MRYRSPAHMAYRDNQTFDHLTMTEFNTLERPPSYDTTMRDSTTVTDTTAANLYYASDRQSVRSKASTRSKKSTRTNNTVNNNYERREDLPWVHITPSTHGESLHHRNYP